MGERWYNSCLASAFGIGVVVIGLGIGCATIMRGCNDSSSSRQYGLQEANLNKNLLPEKFYNIDGKIAVVEVDGKSIVDKINEE